MSESMTEKCNFCDKVAIYQVIRKINYNYCILDYLIEYCEDHFWKRKNDKVIILKDKKD